MDVKWYVSDPGTLTMRGADFWVLYDPDCGANFAVYCGNMFVGRANLLADAKRIASSLLSDLVELALMGPPEI